MTAFDAIVVGAGEAGPPLAARLTAAGMRVALVERKLLGGTCVNTGCTPTKALVASARAAHVARHAERWGVFHDGAVRVDMAKVAARARKVSEDARAG
jgi:pyruvate/2-oxoglutarate dehydrogenase complex dihydrolipoamide dehydrogenase (E3) component